MEKIFAIPTENKKLCAHFGRCESFALIEVENYNIVKESYLDPPVHQPGTYPAFFGRAGCFYHNYWRYGCYGSESV